MERESKRKQEISRGMERKERGEMITQTYTHTQRDIKIERQSD